MGSQTSPPKAFSPVKLEGLLVSASFLKRKEKPIFLFSFVRSFLKIVEGRLKGDFGFKRQKKRETEKKKEKAPL